jgi:hypothetical protein
VITIGDIIPGPIKSARTLAKELGIRQKKDGTYNMKDSSGNLRSVSPMTPVYHRGKGNVAIYGADRDLHIKAKHRNRKGKLIGTGPYRHQSDKYMKTKK